MKCAPDGKDERFIPVIRYHNIPADQQKMHTQKAIGTKGMRLVSCISHCQAPASKYSEGEQQMVMWSILGLILAIEPMTESWCKDLEGRATQTSSDGEESMGVAS